MWGGDGTIICPDAVRVQLVWSVILRPGTTSGSLYYYQFRGNSVYDPDYTGTGTQPNGFDQWASFYNTYVVLGSSIKAEVMGATQSCLSVLVPNFNATLATSASDAVGYRYSKSRLTGYSGNAALVTLNNKISTAQICGVDDRAVAFDSDYSATVSTNPGNNESWFWDFYHQNTYDTSTLNTVVKITIHYDVKFFDPQQQGLSATRHLIDRSPSIGCTVTARGDASPGVVSRAPCQSTQARACAASGRCPTSVVDTTTASVGPAKADGNGCACGSCGSGG
jgi:hypothetical protein